MMTAKALGSVNEMPSPARECSPAFRPDFDLLKPLCKSTKEWPFPHGESNPGQLDENQLS
jgi:hypothetical protein